MNCFQLVKSVLDEIYAEIHLPGDAEKDAAIKNKLDYLSGTYKKLTDFGDEVDYTDPITRFAYIYCYVTSHANMIYKIIGFCHDLRILMNASGTVNMTSIGCGPGSDLLGVLKYLSGLDQYPHITCRLYDREEAWRKSWQGIYEKIEQNLRISTIFQQFDVKTSSALNDPSEYLDSDFFTMSYFMSEIYKIKDDVQPFLENLFANAKNGSLFLYIDNNNQQFYNWFDDLARRNSFEEIMSGANYIGMESGEQKTDLGVFYEKFKEVNQPKLGANIAYRICRKVKK